MVGSIGVPTFLFSDIEGSTLLWERFPDEMAEALALHNRLLESAYIEHRGTVFKTVGDEYCVAFDNPSDAVSAADAAQMALAAAKWPPHCPIKVRIAIHSGPANCIGTDYYGPTLNRVARLMNAVNGGQTVVSGATFSLLPSTGRTKLVELGQHRLKDLQEPLQLYQVATQEQFPPLRTLNAKQTNLPCQATTFVGRRLELEEVRLKLRKSRLVTLTGLGGTGKTRLAIQAGAEEVEKQPDGVWLVDLSAINDPSAVPIAMASAIELGTDTGTGSIIQALSTKRMLLILDCCEHLLEEVAELVRQIISLCPFVTVLGTSREVLGLAGETVIRLASLSAPAPEDPYSLDALMNYDSIRLFEDRAKAVRPEFQLTDRNAACVAKLCWRLEGIPLAIELAAARIRAMPIEQVEARVSDRFGFLKGGRRSTLPRQQTLRSLIDWSYDLLNEPEKKLLRRLSVFAGGWSLESAERVCGDGGLIDGEEILDLLTSLVDKSLAIFEEDEGYGRYRMLETVRQYALERLQDCESYDQYRDRHADVYLQAIEQRLTELHSHGRSDAIRKLREDIDNIVAALEWSERRNDLAERLMSVMHAAWPFFHTATSNKWRLGLLTRILELWADKLPEHCVTTAIYLRCLHLALAGERNEAREQLRKLWDSQDEPRYTKERLNPMGYVHWLLGDTDGAQRLFRMAEESAGDDLGIMAYSTSNQGNLALYQARYDDAERLLSKALDAHRRNRDVRAEIATMSSLAKLAWARGDRQSALEWFAAYSRLEQSWGYSAIHARQARDAARYIADRDYRHAAMLWGAAQEMDEVEGPLADPVDSVGNAAFEQELRDRLGEEGYSEAVAEGADSLAWARLEIRCAISAIEQAGMAGSKCC